MTASLYIDVWPKSTRPMFSEKPQSDNLFINASEQVQQCHQNLTMTAQNMKTTDQFHLHISMQKHQIKY